MPKIAFILFLLEAALVAQGQGPHSPTQQTVKGCLSSAPPGSYQLIDDETGSPYRLVGDPEDLRMLVGTDVLVNGHPLDAREAELEMQQDKPNAPDGGDTSTTTGGQSRGETAGQNSFRVVSAIKVSDLCILSGSQPVASLTEQIP